MKTVKIFWVGTSKSGNHYFGCTYEEKGFIIKCFVQVTEEKLGELEVDAEIEVPRSALS